ncbi:hypothetical protein E6C67_26650 [Azospirillum sp. TSA2s]|nr:hypothetical protein E6C67_26650 [Azospirillum sp. TSA2s]
MRAEPPHVQTVSSVQTGNTSNIIPFDFEGTAVRAIGRDGEPWFILADICRVLEIGNPSQAATRLDDDEKTTLTNNEGQASYGPQSFTIVNESGLWSLVLTSRKAAAKRFKKWLTADVIPTIRKTGSYSVAAPQPAKKPSRPRLTGPVLRELTGFPERLRAEFPSMSEAERLAAFNRFSASLLGEPLLPERRPDVFPIDVDVLPALPAPSHPEFVSASEIGVVIGVRLGMVKLSGAAVNKLLVQQGFQMTGPTKTTKWVPTAKGEPFAHWETAEKAGERGGTANWLRWRYGIVDELVDAMTAGQGEG